MAPTPEEQVKIVFDRLRAQLLNSAEALGLPETQLAATKRAIKDYSSDAWNRITSIVNSLQK